jgi:hypothetical protein
MEADRASEKFWVEVMEKCHRFKNKDFSLSLSPSLSEDEVIQRSRLRLNKLKLYPVLYMKFVLQLNKLKLYPVLYMKFVLQFIIFHKPCLGTTIVHITNYKISRNFRIPSNQDCPRDKLNDVRPIRKFPNTWRHNEVTYTLHNIKFVVVDIILRQNQCMNSATSGV